MGKLLLIAIAFLAIGGYLIINSNDYDLDSDGDKKDFLSKFWSWIKTLFGNIKDLTGLAVEQEWLPDNNETNTTEV